jgi:hypothetical protein
MNFFDLEGEYVESSCTFIPAIVEYNISIEDRHVTINAQENQRKVVDLANNTAGVAWRSKAGEKQPSTLDTLINFLAFVSNYALQANSFISC